MPSEADYQVGYGKPPRHTRFRKGQSGNPRGRPPGSKNLATIVGEALEQKVVVNDNGRRRKISKREAMITQLVNRSAQPILKPSRFCSGSSTTSSAVTKPILPKRVASRQRTSKSLS